ncbi:hypothetical protein TREMEDRAFT_66359 [Tremella mesenterica DSM 1558]|uniref:uncharacterized protein n=1 Tax=Tremella mesenterica (strain ATCC 24925 / CBS 8224 / DSM 1558 / NBRC 9311 / NRRL Y-6157 / RJB 2259-6 / UBC 559-6) TaxID=578456 RepID=UPI00032D1E20|nr:uncharacterized protein TREMEDRAFT_66359 [Tremella mesenterica DSM 1558]EIW65636.1 hypothetical protein TREMEDRAFT_66359 [Tremella mesenterica DSM 1558]
MYRWIPSPPTSTSSSSASSHSDTFRTDGFDGISVVSDNSSQGGLDNLSISSVDSLPGSGIQTPRPNSRRPELQYTPLPIPIVAFNPSIPSHCSNPNHFFRIDTGVGYGFAPITHFNGPEPPDVYILQSPPDETNRVISYMPTGGLATTGSVLNDITGALSTRIREHQSAWDTAQSLEEQCNPNWSFLDRNDLMSTIVSLCNFQLNTMVRGLPPEPLALGTDDSSRYLWNINHIVTDIKRHSSRSGPYFKVVCCFNDRQDMSLKLPLIADHQITSLEEKQRQWCSVRNPFSKPPPHSSELGSFVTLPVTPRSRPDRKAGPRYMASHSISGLAPPPVGSPGTTSSRILPSQQAGSSSLPAPSMTMSLDEGMRRVIEQKNSTLRRYKVPTWFSGDAQQTMSGTQLSDYLFSQAQKIIRDEYKKMDEWRRYETQLNQQAGRTTYEHLHREELGYAIHQSIQRILITFLQPGPTGDRGSQLTFPLRSAWVNIKRQAQAHDQGISSPRFVLKVTLKPGYTLAREVADDRTKMSTQ